MIISIYILFEFNPKIFFLNFRGNRSEQFKNLHFSRGYNFWTNDLYSETSYSYVFVSSISYCLFRTCLNVWFIGCRPMKNVSFPTVPIWLLHTVHLEGDLSAGVGPGPRHLLLWPPIPPQTSRIIQLFKNFQISLEWHYNAPMKNNLPYSDPGWIHGSGLGDSLPDPKILV